MPDPIIANQNPITPPPAFPEMTDIPNIPITPPDTTTTTPPPVTTTTSDDTNQTQHTQDIPPIITNEKPKKKGGKILATILGIFLLIGAVGAGVVLVDQNQDIRERAGTMSCYCATSDCSGGCWWGSSGPNSCSTDKCPNRDITDCEQTQQGQCVPSGWSCTAEYGAMDCGSGYKCATNCSAPTPPQPPQCANEFQDCGSTSDCCNSLSCINRKCQENISVPPTKPICSQVCSTLTGCDGNLICFQGYCKNPNCPANNNSDCTCPSDTTTTTINCSSITKTSTSLGCPEDLFIAGQCWVTHFWCPSMVRDTAHDGCSEQTLAIKVKSASFSKDCGVEQIDMYYPACTDTTKKFVSKTDDLACGTTPPTSPPTTPPGDIARCESVKVYDSEWNLLSNTELSSLSAGDVVRFTINGSPADKIDKARFTITPTGGNITQSGEITDKKSGTDEYYYEYTIPSGVTSFNVTAQVHHLTLGWF